MLRILRTQDAFETLLKRLPPDEMEIPESVLDSLYHLFGERISPEIAVSRILRSIREGGDQALHKWASRLDGYSRTEFRVSRAEIQNALDAQPLELRQAMEFSARRIRDFHNQQPISSWITQTMGGTIGQLVRPIRRVGLYVPGGTAPLPSSVLMAAIPAQVAGVSEIVVTAPPAGSDGQIAPIILAACAVAGVHEVYTLGGAQAIGALAYGTPSIRAVDKIFGPGNLFVTLAKRQVYGVVGIDGLAGPTETMVIADGEARPDWVAADMLAQAEHDILASAILITPSKELALAVQAEVARQLETLSRADIIACSLEQRSGILLTRDLIEAVELANRYAPEHLCLAVNNPWSLADRITCAGGIYLGETSFEVLGDYVAGPSHVMPTGGTARFASPLNVLDFIHLVSLVALDRETAAEISPAASILAHAEGLDAHARSAEIRLETA